MIQPIDNNLAILFLQMLTLPNVNKAEAVDLMADHPKEAMFALDRANENIERLRQDICARVVEKAKAKEDAKA